MEPVRVAVVGAGQIGRKHVEQVVADPDSRLAAIVDPDPAAADLAARQDVAWFADVAALLAGQDQAGQDQAGRDQGIDGVIVATPTGLHADVGQACLDADLPVLIEKPLCATLADAERLTATAEARGVPLLVGHQRRYNPAVAAARRVIDSGALGRIVGVSGLWSVRKPDGYFAPDWRRTPGGGPILINLIHEIDLLRHLIGDIAAVAAMTSSAVRGFATEDTVSLTLRFAGGALGSFLLSDAAVSPWTWEQATGENTARFPASRQNSWRLVGTDGALEFPRLRLWRHPGAATWEHPITAADIPVPAADAYDRQMAHFVQVIRGGAAPLIDGRDGQRTLAATLAVMAAADSGTAIPVSCP